MKGVVFRNTGNIYLSLLEVSRLSNLDKEIQGNPFHMLRTWPGGPYF
jgi:hypothetical protein